MIWTKFRISNPQQAITENTSHKVSEKIWLKLVKTQIYTSLKQGQGVCKIAFYSFCILGDFFQPSSFEYFFDKYLSIQVYCISALKNRVV